MVAWSADKTHRPIEYYLEGRHHGGHGTCRFASHRENVQRQTHEIANVVQRNMEMLRSQEFTVQSMFFAQTPCEPCDA